MLKVSVTTFAVTATPHTHTHTPLLISTDESVELTVAVVEGTVVF